MGNAVAGIALIIATVQAFISTVALSSYREEVLLARRIENCAAFIDASNRAWRVADNLHTRLNAAARAHLVVEADEGAAELLAVDAELASAADLLETYSSALLAFGIVFEDGPAYTAAGDVFGNVKGRFESIGTRVGAWRGGAALQDMEVAAYDSGHVNRTAKLFDLCRREARGR